MLFYTPNKDAAVDFTKSYATLTLGRIWILVIRGELAQNLRIDSEYFHFRPRSPLDLSVPICYEFLRMLNNASQ